MRITKCAKCGITIGSQWSSSNLEYCGSCRYSTQTQQERLATHDPRDAEIAALRKRIDDLEKRIKRLERDCPIGLR